MSISYAALQKSDTQELFLCPPISGCDPSDYSFQILVNEIVSTAIFVSLICAVKYYDPVSSKSDALGAFSVSLTLYGCISTIGATTGACLNPAVGLC